MLTSIMAPLAPPPEPDAALPPRVPTSRAQPHLRPGGSHPVRSCEPAVQNDTPPSRGSSLPAQDQEPVSNRLLRGLSTSLPVIVLLGAIARPALATPDLTLWVYLSSVVLFALAGRVVMDEERLRQTGGRDQTAYLVVGISLLASPILGAFEFARIGPLVTIPVDLRWIAIVFIIAGHVVRLWAASANPFFSGLIILHRDRGHTLVDSGPYRIVRHPGYAGLLLVLLATPALFSSILALGASLPGLVGLFGRTAREDRFLADHLEGYRAYQSQVRARLVPGLY